MTIYEDILEEEIRLLKGQKKRLLKTLKEQCVLYCKWYDEGLPGIDGSNIAYELVSMARTALAEVIND